jgi:hypothetical protein
VIGGLNIFGVILAALAAIIIGVVWCSPRVFGAAWMKKLGKTSPKQLGSSTKPLVNVAVMNMVLAFALALVFRWLGAKTSTDVLMASLVVGAGLVLSNQLMRDRFYGASMHLSLINGANTAVVYLAMGTVLYCAG